MVIVMVMAKSRVGSKALSRSPRQRLTLFRASEPNEMGGGTKVQSYGSLLPKPTYPEALILLSYLALWEVFQSTTSPPPAAPFVNFGNLGQVHLRAVQCSNGTHQG